MIKKKTTVNIKLETALPQNTMVISPGVQPRKEKVTKKKRNNKSATKSHKYIINKGY